MKLGAQNSLQKQENSYFCAYYRKNTIFNSKIYFWTLIYFFHPHIRHIPAICCSPFSSDLCYIWLKTFMILWLLSLWPASMKRHNGRSGVAERMALGQAQLSCGPFSQQCHFWWGVTLQNTSELQSDTSTHATGSVCSAMMAQQKHILFCHVQLMCSYVGKKVLISGISCLMTTHLARSRLHECCLAHRMRHVWQACFS